MAVLLDLDVRLLDDQGAAVAKEAYDQLRWVCQRRLFLDAKALTQVNN